MIVEQGFQFLNTLCLSFKNKIMLPVGQGYKVSRAIIMFDSIKMMNYPSFGQWLSVGLLPNKDVFHDIASFLSMRMRWLANINISTCTESSATFPERMFFRGSIFEMFNETFFTHIMGILMHLTTALRTYPRIMFRVSQAIFSLILSCFRASIISCNRFFLAPLNAIRAIRFLMARCFKGNFTILTLLVNHLTYQCNTTKAKSQAGGYYG